MGKTAAGAVWLNSESLSDWDYWQFWRNTSDADVGRFLKLFTFMPMEEIAKLEALEGAELNEAKKILATEATALARGREAAIKALETATRAFEQGGSAGLPTKEIEKSLIDNGYAVIDAMIDVGFAASKSEARRLIKGGGVKINDKAIPDDKVILSGAHVNDNQIKLSVGKKKHYLLKLA